MATVFITTTAKVTKWSPYSRVNYERVMRAAEADSVGRHKLTDDPSHADIILFVEASSTFHFDILRSELYGLYPDKCFVFDSQDYTVPLLPGIYMCIPKHLSTSPLYRYGFYIRVFDNQMLNEFLPVSDCEYLFSFVGKAANCERIRRPVLELNHPRAFLADSSSHQADNDSKYVAILKKSKFVVCPRGFGPSTWRCFEAMKAGRVPVIVSDDWFPPPGLDWEEFTVRVPETEINTIPSLLEHMEDRAGEMGAKARTAWYNNFALDKSFNWLVQTCLDIRPYISSNSNLLRRNRLPEIPSGRLSRFVKDYISSVRNR